jgi:hypothetical protein
MLGDVIGILEHTLVRRRGTDGADHPFPDPCDDGLRTSPAQQPVNVGAVSSKETGTVKPSAALTSYCQARK